MAEISVQFKNRINGYDKTEVDQCIRDFEAKLQEKTVALAKSEQQNAALEEKIHGMTNGDKTVEEKVEMYEKLMRKMDGDYNNLLAPAVAKAKAIEAKANEEYAIRIDQAKCSAEGIYTETADRIAAAVNQAVDAKMDDLTKCVDGYLYKKTLMGRIKSVIEACKVVKEKAVEATKAVAVTTKKALELPGKAKNAITDATEKAKGKTVQFSQMVGEKVQSFKKA